MKKKILTLGMVAVLILSSWPVAAFAIPAEAARASETGEITYLDWNPETRQQEEVTKELTYTVIDDEYANGRYSSNRWTKEWYVVNQNVEVKKEKRFVVTSILLLNKGAPLPFRLVSKSKMIMEIFRMEATTN